MLSTPPATYTSPSPAMMRWAAEAMVCRPLEQKRLIVMPLADTGSPARSAIWRAMLLPVAPSGVAQHINTSSTSAPSMPARSTAAFTACPPSVAPWVMLKAPFQLLASGVRAVETITAEVMVSSSGMRAGAVMGSTAWDGSVGRARSVEGLAFGRQASQQRRGLPERAVVQRVLREALHRGDHVEQTQRVGIAHGPAAVEREPVAGQVDHVHIGGTQRNAFLDDLRGLVHQREHQALHDFLVADLARRDAERGAVLLQHLGHHLRRDRIALARLVVVPTGARLLAEAAQLAQQVGRLSVAHVRLLDLAALAH